MQTLRCNSFHTLEDAKNIRKGARIMKDTTINYQALAQAIVLNALAEANGEGQDATLANQWLDTLNSQMLVLTGLHPGMMTSDQDPPSSSTDRSCS